MNLRIATRCLALSLSVVTGSCFSLAGPGGFTQSVERSGLVPGARTAHKVLQEAPPRTSFEPSLLAAAAAACVFFLGPRKKSSSVRAVASSPVILRARSAEPSVPVGVRGKKRSVCGLGRFFLGGKQISVRVNWRTNKATKYRMHVKAGDVVQVIRGKDRGKVTTVLRTYSKWNKILCLGVNYNIKHVRPMREEEVGQRVQVEAPMSATRVMHYSEKEGVVGYLGIRYEQYTKEDGTIDFKKVRYNKATGEEIPKRDPPKWIPVLDRT